MWAGQHTRYLSTEECAAGMGVLPSDARWKELTRLPSHKAQEVVAQSAHVTCIEKVWLFGLSKITKLLPSKWGYSTAFTGFTDTYDVLFQRYVSGGSAVSYRQGAESDGFMRGALEKRHPRATFWRDACTPEASAGIVGSLVHAQGFRCQPVSPMGKLTSGSAEERNAKALTNVEGALLSLDALAIESDTPLASMPWILILENNKGFEEGCLRSVFDYFNKQLAARFPYVWYRQILCPAAHFGIPWRRPRWFWVGIRADIHCSEGARKRQRPVGDL